MSSRSQAAASSKSPKTNRTWKLAWSWMKVGISVVGILILLITFTPLVPWWAHELAGSFDNQRGDSLIVLASADSADGILSYSSYLRCEYAIRAWREGWPKVILISGGRPAGEPTAKSMAAFIESQGVPADMVRTETNSISTRENALQSKAVVASLPGKVVLLTSDYHMYRARRTFEKAGIPVVPRPFPDAYKRGSSGLGRWPAFLDLCEESAKIGYYRIRGWI